jgi:formate dehydrogenase subunit beta
MAQTATIDAPNKDISLGIKNFLGQLLKSGLAEAVLLPLRQPGSTTVMPGLVTDPDALEQADLLAPVAPLSAARMAARLTRRSTGKPVAAVLRPCEVRAFIELVKFNQAKAEDILLISADCAGVMSNKDYGTFAAAEASPPGERFWKAAGRGDATQVDGFSLASACKVCEQPFSSSADISLGILGADGSVGIPATANTQKGEDALKKLGLDQSPPNKAHQKVLSMLVERRSQAKQALFATMEEKVNSLGALNKYFENCVNCYNCRVACPICYCRECVFLTDAFDHDPPLYLNWAFRNKAIKMPTDTAFFHLTRLAHMSTSCVGCGQCTNACPNDIPVADLFIRVSAATQKAFEYQPGQSLEEKPPLAVFEADEFGEAVGIKSKAAS